MDKPRVSKIFDIPPYYYFESGNDYSGSKNLNQFNYKVEYGKENLTLKIWHGMLCSEKATIEIEQTYPNNAEGFQEMIHFFRRNLSKRTSITKIGSEDFPLHCRSYIKKSFTLTAL